jgi:hypothetical protein
VSLAREAIIEGTTPLSVESSTCCLDWHVTNTRRQHSHLIALVLGLGAERPALASPSRLRRLDPLARATKAEVSAVDVAPRPQLAGFDGADDGMPGHAEVLASVPGSGAVTTADYPASEAHPQVNPA